ncbi:MAG: hypothetical protein MZW92_01935, partial [Comamonadaceae bacterium]|nr:hypothetical protein [Comamonadaceae bacterium]
MQAEADVGAARLGAQPPAASHKVRARRAPSRPSEEALHLAAEGLTSRSEVKAAAAAGRSHKVGAQARLSRPSEEALHLAA